MMTMTMMIVILEVLVMMVVMVHVALMGRVVHASIRHRGLLVLLLTRAGLVTKFVLGLVIVVMMVLRRLGLWILLLVCQLVRLTLLSCTILLIALLLLVQADHRELLLQRDSL